MNDDLSGRWAGEAFYDWEVTLNEGFCSAVGDTDLNREFSRWA